VDANWIIVTMFASVVGIALLTYAKKQRDAIALIVAVALFVFPYFVKSVVWCVVITVALLVAFIAAKVCHIGEF